MDRVRLRQDIMDSYMEIKELEKQMAEQGMEDDQISERRAPQPSGEGGDEGATQTASAQERARAVAMLTRKVEDELERFVEALGLK